jgi:hypothetical protein
MYLENITNIFGAIFFRLTMFYQMYANMYSLINNLNNYTIDGWKVQRERERNLNDFALIQKLNLPEII